MPEQPSLLKPKLRALQSSLTFVGLAAIAILLFMGIMASAVWRAFSADSFPPTPTIPANLETNFAFVSGQRGDVFSQPPGTTETVKLQGGDTVGAGRGSLVRTGEGGWLRLGSQAGTFFLGEATEIELRQLGDERSDRPETILQLNDGVLLLVADSNTRLRYIVFAETGARAETEVGMMGLTYARGSQRFDLHCLDGPCWLAGREGEMLELATGERGWVQGFGEPMIGGPILYELFLELADPGLVPTATPLPGGVTPVVVPTPDQPTTTPVHLPPTQPPATFTPKPSASPPPLATKTATAPAATATDEATPTIVATETPWPTEAATATLLPTLPPSSATPLPTSTSLPATATSAPTNTPAVPTPSNTPLPTATVTVPAGTMTPTPTPVPPG